MDDYNPFFDELKEHKALAASARHKKNGSKTKKCSLPSDNLTPAQRKKLNGPVQTYELHAPMSWAVFKTMPIDLQQAHLDYIQRRFRVGANIISTEIFGRSTNGLADHMRRKGLKLTSYKGKLVSRETLDELRKWVAREETPPSGEEVIEPTPSAIIRSVSVSAVGTAEELTRVFVELLADRSAEVEIAVRYRD